MTDYQNLGGMISTVVTPFTEQDEVDYDLLRAEVRYLLDSGISAICACGSTGEGQTLSLEESAEIIRVVAEEVDGRLPVIAGVIQNSTRQAIRYAQAVRDAGADIIQATPVHYVFKPGVDEQVTHFKLIAQETGLPIILYNVVPWALLGLDVIDRLAAEVPEVISIKQSGGDMHLLADILHSHGERFRVLAALDDLHYPAFVLGAHGALAAIPTVTPHLSVELWDAVQRGDHTEALKLHNRILTVWHAIDRPNLPATIKAALRLLGRDGGRPREPFSPATEDDYARISTALRDAGLIE